MATKWHYQVMRHTAIRPDGGKEVWYGIHEYYELECGESWTEVPSLSADSVEELKDILKLMEGAIYKYGVKEYRQWKPKDVV